MNGRYIISTHISTRQLGFLHTYSLCLGDKLNITQNLYTFGVSRQGKKKKALERERDEDIITFASLQSPTCQNSSPEATDEGDS